ncbi:MAG: glutathione S-transferase family protein [Pseudomonadales bacterium]
MLKLYGFPVSNYFNMVKIALLEKQIDFEEVIVYPDQDADYSSKSPMRKVPCIGTEHGFLSETSVILDFLEQQYPDIPLYPVDPFERAKVRELVKYIELYLELPARRLYPGAFFGGSNSEETIQEVRPVLERGAAAVKALAKFGPFIAGDSLSYADILASQTLPNANGVAQSVYGWKLMDDIPGAQDLLQILEERPAFSNVNKAMREGLAAFLAKMK